MERPTSSGDAGTARVIDAIVGVTISSSADSEDRTFDEVLNELKEVLNSDLRVHVYNQLPQLPELAEIKSRDEYFTFLKRFTELTKEVHSNVHSITKNGDFINSIAELSATWADGTQASWWICVVGRYAD